MLVVCLTSHQDNTAANPVFACADAPEPPPDETRTIRLLGNPLQSHILLIGTTVDLVYFAVGFARPFGRRHLFLPVPQ